LERRSAEKTATIATLVNLVAELRIILCIAIHLPVASAGRFCHRLLLLQYSAEYLVGAGLARCTVLGVATKS